MCAWRGCCGRARSSRFSFDFIGFAKVNRAKVIRYDWPEMFLSVAECFFYEFKRCRVVSLFRSGLRLRYKHERRHGYAWRIHRIDSIHEHGVHDLRTAIACRLLSNSSLALVHLHDCFARRQLYPMSTRHLSKAKSEYNFTNETKPFRSFKGIQKRERRIRQSIRRLIVPDPKKQKQK